MKKLAEYFVETEQTIAEKAVSQQQQKFMGMVHAMQKGKKIKGASPELKKVARTMKKSDAKDFAKTKHKDLPKKISESPEDLLKSGLKQVIQDIHDGAIAGHDMIDNVADELGDFYKWVRRSKDQSLRRAYQFMIEKGGNAEGDPEMMAQAAKKALSMLDSTIGEDSVEDFLSRGGQITVGKYHRPRKSEKTDYGSKHIGTGKPGKRSSQSGTAANVGGMGKPVVTADIHSESAVMAGVRRVTEARLVTEDGTTIDHIVKRYKHEVKVFVENGDLDTDLYHTLFDYYFDKGEIPYGVAKGRTGDPYEWISERFYRDLQDEGLVEAADPLEIPAYQRKHSARLGNFPAPVAPKIDVISKARPEDIPAVQRKASGKDFPVTMDQVQDTSDKISHLDTLRKMAGLPPKA